MSDQATEEAQPFPPGLSRLERLPDELKLRVGYYLMPPVEVKMAREHVVPTRTGHRHHLPSELFSNLLRRNLLNENDELKVLRNEHKYSDSVLALASTSTRLCDVFLVEHSKKYGLQNTLLRSIELGKLKLVRRTVEYGADINKINTESPWKLTALQLAVQAEQLPIILYFLRRGVDEADELVMDILPNKFYQLETYEVMSIPEFTYGNFRNRCRCNLLHDLLDAALGSSQASHAGQRLPRETQEALAPTGHHLWFILRTCMRREWECDCGEKDGVECPMRLISLLRRYGAKWMPYGPLGDTPKEDTLSYLSGLDDDWMSIFRDRSDRRRGLADLRRFKPRSSLVCLSAFTNYEVLAKPSVAGAMHGTLLASAAYRRDHCIPFLVAMLKHGITAEQGDLSYAMDLASTPDTMQLSIAIVVALLRAGTDANEPGAMKTAMRLACMEETKDAAVAFVTLLLEHGADPSAEELRDEIQGAAEKWWVQSNWQSSDVFCRILRLLVQGGLDEHVAREIFAVLGLDHGLLAEGGGGSTKV